MIVYNITDRLPSADGARAIPVGGVLLRPGKSAEVAEKQLAKKLMALHGVALWFGPLPQHLRARVAPPTATLAPMTSTEIQEYLSLLDLAELTSLAARLTPPLLLTGREPAAMLGMRLASALRGGRIPDPEAFFWLRRWTRRGDTFTERD